ncbi:acyl carrier protein [Echinicola shivajiensis]|uniref:acyl carrier protein n=1 Tax=Echinicola shivajiensis TaxID=1035916 RepID=UPI001BFC561F|nr:phosphopantetheine-binding protein [Echinicola shivajiensis]
MKDEELLKIVYDLLKQIAPETDPSSLSLDENIRESLNIDSYDALQFIVALSEKLGVDIPEKDYGQTSNLKNLLRYLEKKLN